MVSIFVLIEEFEEYGGDYIFKKHKHFENIIPYTYTEDSVDICPYREFILENVIMPISPFTYVNLVDVIIHQDKNTGKFSFDYEEYI